MLFAAFTTEFTTERIKLKNYEMKTKKYLKLVRSGKGGRIQDLTNVSLLYKTVIENYQSSDNKTGFKGYLCESGVTLQMISYLK